MAEPQKPQTSVRIEVATMKKLRIVAALLGEKQFQTLDRLINDEFERVEKKRLK